MDPVSTNLCFSNKLKTSYKSNRPTDEISYSQLNSKENVYLESLSSIFSQESGSSYADSIKSTRDVSSFKYLADVKRPETKDFSVVNTNTGIPGSEITSDTDIKFNRFRSSCRDFDTPPIISGYKGRGTNSGNVCISTDLRNSIKSNHHKSAKDQMWSSVDRFQIFDPEEFSKVAPYGANGVQDYIRGGGISRY